MASPGMLQCVVATVLRGDFEWDDDKAAANERKHGITFVEATTVFEDADLLVNVDPVDPARFVAVGFSSGARVLVVVHVSRRSVPGSFTRTCYLWRGESLCRASRTMSSRSPS